MEIPEYIVFVFPSSPFILSKCTALTTFDTFHVATFCFPPFMIKTEYPVNEIQDHNQDIQEHKEKYRERYYYKTE